MMIESLNEKALEAAEARVAELEKALESAREIVDACAGDNRPAIEWASEVREKIDAALSCAAVAEREPVAWQRRCLFPDKHTREKPQWQDCPAMEVKSWPQHDYQYRPLYADPLPLTDLEAENASLRKALDALDRMSRGLDWCDQDEQTRRWSTARRALKGGENGQA